MNGDNKYRMVNECEQYDGCTGMMGEWWSRQSTSEIWMDTKKMVASSGMLTSKYDGSKLNDR